MTDSTPQSPPRPSRRNLLLGGAALGAGAVIAPLGAASPASATIGTMTVATANIMQGMSWTEFMEDLDKAAEKADLLGLNEAFEFPRRLARWAAARGFHIVQAENGPKRNLNAGTNVLLARKSRFEPRTPSLAGHEVANRGGGTHWKHPRPTWVDWTTWREVATGIEIVHLNTHTTRGIEAHGRPTRKLEQCRRDNPDTCRVQIAASQLKRVRDLATFMSSGGLEVVVTGDLNVDWVKDKVIQDENFPYAILESSGTTDLGLRSSFSMQPLPEPATQGRRYIDYIYEWVRQADMRRIAMTSNTVVPLDHSDHNALTATFNLNSGGHAAG